MTTATFHCSPRRLTSFAAAAESAPTTLRKTTLRQQSVLVFTAMVLAFHLISKLASFFTQMRSPGSTGASTAGRTGTVPCPNSIVFGTWKQPIIDLNGEALVEPWNAACSVLWAIQ
jgi:hypothetical protein